MSAVCAAVATQISRNETANRKRSETECSGELNNTPALLGGGGSEQRRGHRSRRAIESESEVLVGRERPQCMIEEVVGVRAELELLSFLDSEALEQAQIGIEVSRSIDRRKNRGALFAYT